jgi:N-dimethylarginine dimethylaminohydrolase
MQAVNPSIYKRLLMAEPTYFDVEYAINPFMKDAQGHLNKIDKEKARSQWEELKNNFLNLGLQVDVLPAQKGLPDLVFTANQSFPFIHPKTLRPSVILSHMRSEKRQPEVALFRDWFQNQDYDIYELSDQKLAFESNGDLIPHPGKNFFWGGFGARTDRAVYNEIARMTGLEIQALELIHPDFYHLDTCFAILSSDTCAVVEEAIALAGLHHIEKRFPEVIRISLDEGKKYFAGNAFCPDGKNVLLQKGSLQFKRDLCKRGFQVTEVDTSEYMKSGGSVFCMKLALPF